MDETVVRPMTIEELAAKAEGGDLIIASFMDAMNERLSNVEIALALLITRLDPPKGPDYGAWEPGT
jgi:hypothetical protein